MTTPTDLAQALLPCPFCGSNPEIHRQGNAHTLKRRVVIRCATCRIERADAAIRKDMKWVEEIAIEHWNRRAHESRAQPASVPSEPTFAMFEAFRDWEPERGKDYAGAQSVTAYEWWAFRKRYAAMIAAAPQPAKDQFDSERNVRPGDIGTENDHD